jgi:hypothetical protein
MAKTETMVCDFCGRTFNNYEGDIQPISIRIPGPVVTEHKPEVKTEAGIQAIAIEESRIDHDQDIEITDLCGTCMSALRDFVKARRGRED